MVGTFSRSRVRFPAAPVTLFCLFPPLFGFCSLKVLTLEVDLNDISTNGYIIGQNFLNSLCFSAISRISSQFLAHLLQFLGRFRVRLPDAARISFFYFFPLFSLFLALCSLKDLRATFRFTRISKVCLASPSNFGPLDDFILGIYLEDFVTK